MTNSSLFNSDIDDIDEVVPTPDAIKTEEYLGEGKRWKTVEDVIKGKLEADNTVRRRESELATLRQELNNRLSVEEAMTKLAQASRQPVGAPNSQPATPAANEQSGISDTPKPSLTIEDVEKLLSQKTKAVEQENNQKFAKQKLTELFGDNYVNVVAKKAKEMGEPIEFFEDLAKSRPNVLLSLLGPAPAAAPSAPSLFNSVNPTQQVLNRNSNSGERTKSFYDNLKKEDPRKFFNDRKLQEQMHRDAVRLGEAFFDS